MEVRAVEFRLLPPERVRALGGFLCIDETALERNKIPLPGGLSSVRLGTRRERLLRVALSSGEREG